MNNYNDKILQILKEGIQIEKLLNPNLVEELDNEFKDKTITPIKLSFIIEEEQKAARLVTLIHKNNLQANNKQLIIDVENPDDLDSIVNCISKLNSVGDQMCLATDYNNINENFSIMKNPTYGDNIYSNETYTYLSDYKQIHKFFLENTLPKYNLSECIMIENSKEPRIETEYYFFIKDNLSSKELSELSLKINFDLYYFCKRMNNPSFFKTLIIISR